MKKIVLLSAFVLPLLRLVFSAGAVVAAKHAISSARASWPEEKILASFAALAFAGWAGSNLLDIYLQERKVKRAFRDAYDSE